MTAEIVTIRNVPLTAERADAGDLARAFNGSSRFEVGETFRRILGMKYVPFYPSCFNNPLENRMRNLSAVFGSTAIWVGFMGGMVLLIVWASNPGGMWGYKCTFIASLVGSIVGVALVGLGVNEIRRYRYMRQPEENVQERLTHIMEKALEQWENPSIYREHRNRRISMALLERAITSYYGRERCEQGRRNRDERFLLIG